MNCLGDSNMMLRREAFMAVGGFHSSVDETSADRALLIRLLIKGFQLYCTDECLFAYCLNPQSMSRTAKQLQRERTVMRAFTENLDPWLARLLESNYFVDGIQVDNSPVIQSKTALAAQRGKLREERRKRRERDSRVDHLFNVLTKWRQNTLVRFARFMRWIPRDY